MKYWFMLSIFYELSKNNPSIFNTIRSIECTWATLYTPAITCWYIKNIMLSVSMRDPWLLFSIPGLFSDRAKRFLSIVELNVTVDRELSMTRFFSDVSIVSLLCDWWVKPINDITRYSDQQIPQTMITESSITNLFLVAFIQCVKA